MTISDFLLARIDADALRATQEAGQRPVGTDPENQDLVRALAECDARRLIVDLETQADVVTPLLRVLAAAYAEHPDYDDCWRP